MEWLERLEAIIRFEKIGIIEAAQRQLRTACRLFLQGGDTISIHTLGWAVHELLEKYPRSTGSFLEQMAHEPEAPRKLRRQLHEAHIFFKHYQQEPHKILKFTENLNDWLLLDCSQMYFSITKKYLRESYAVSAWVCSRHPTLNLLKKNPALMEFIQQARLSKRDLLKFADTDPRFDTPDFE